jgi:hypothetical protein
MRKHKTLKPKDFSRRGVKLRADSNHMMHVREFDQANVLDVQHTRKALGMSAIVIMERLCLSCNRGFTSYGKGHRMCGGCRGRKEE